MKLEKGSRYDSGDDAPIVSVRWKNSSGIGKGSSESDGPALAVIWRAGKISLLRHANDENALVVESGLVASCGDWSPNGAYLAVGGSPVGGTSAGSYGLETKSGEAEEVRVLDEWGKLLQVVRVPGTPLTSLSWDSLSLRLAIGAGNHCSTCYHMNYFTEAIYPILVISIRTLTNESLQAHTFTSLTFDLYTSLQYLVLES